MVKPYKSRCLLVQVAECLGLCTDIMLTCLAASPSASSMSSSPRTLGLFLAVAAGVNALLYSRRRWSKVSVVFPSRSN